MYIHIHKDFFTGNTWRQLILILTLYVSERVWCCFSFYEVACALDTKCKIFQDIYEWKEPGVTFPSTSLVEELSSLFVGVSCYISVSTEACALDKDAELSGKMNGQ